MNCQETHPRIPTSRSLEENGLTRPVKTFRAGAFILKERIHSPALNLPLHYHESSMLSFTSSGYCAERNGGRTQEYGPFDLQVALAGQVHSIRYGREGARTLNIEIESARSEMSQALAAASRLSGCSKDPRLARLAIQVYREFQNLDSFSELAIEGLVLEALARAARCSATRFKGQPPAWLGRVRDLLHTRFNESLRLGNLADAVGTHPVYLARAFHRHYHCTIGEYIRRLRIEFATRELTKTDSPLVDIGLAAGFCAQSHFSSTFKRYTGLSPAQYREVFRSH
jgi:AraC family transcriptional regulator